METLQNILYQGIDWLVLIFNYLGVITIALGGIKGLIIFLKSGLDYTNPEVPVVLAQGMGLALSFLLAAEILLTIVAPDLMGVLEIIGIAALRIGIHFVLHWDLENAKK